MMSPRLFIAFCWTALIALGCAAPEAETTASDQQEESNATDGWDMKAYQFVTLTRNPDRPDMDSTQLAVTMAGHLAHLDSLHGAGIIHLVGPFGDDRALRGFALLDAADSATAMAHMAVDPSVQAGIFVLDSRPWWGPASIDISGAAPH